MDHDGISRAQDIYTHTSILIYSVLIFNSSTPTLGSSQPEYNVPRVLLRSMALRFDVAHQGIGQSQRWLLFPSLSALRTICCHLLTLSMSSPLPLLLLLPPTHTLPMSVLPRGLKRDEATCKEGHKGRGASRTQRMKKRKEIDASAASRVLCTCEEWAFAVGVMG